MPTIFIPQAHNGAPAVNISFDICQALCLTVFFFTWIIFLKKSIDGPWWVAVARALLKTDQNTQGKMVCPWLNLLWQPFCKWMIIIFFTHTNHCIPNEISYLCMSCWALWSDKTAVWISFKWLVSFPHWVHGLPRPVWNDELSDRISQCNLEKRKESNTFFLFFFLNSSLLWRGFAYT